MRSLRDLVNSLECLGVQTPFSVGAIFAKLSDLPVMFSDVQHGAVVSINEDDTEAAAATAVVLREGAYS